MGCNWKCYQILWNCDIIGKILHQSFNDLGNERNSGKKKYKKKKFKQFKQSNIKIKEHLIRYYIKNKIIYKIF